VTEGAVGADGAGAGGGRNVGGGSGVYRAMYARTETPSGPTTLGPGASSRPSRPELVHSYVASRGPEFTDFYRSCWPSVARALSLALGDQDLAVEATDEAMARAYPRWDKLRRYDNPAGWVYRVGLNWARSYHRRLARRLPFAHPADPERHEQHRQPGQHDHVGSAQVADPEIRKALLDLPLRQRAVVVCRLLLDWSVDDTATALGVRPGTVRSRLHRALQSLEASLDHLR
jgi:RNA polymerase sigma factor (sigma-70 family)